MLKLAGVHLFEFEALNIVFTFNQNFGFII